MPRPTMLDIHRARRAKQVTAPLAPTNASVPALMQGFADLDIGTDFHGFMRANAVRDHLGADLVRLASTAHGGKALVAMLVDARSPGFWLELDQPNPYRAFHRLTELRAVVDQASCLRRRH